MVATKRISLPAMNEYRFELDPGERISITLISGTAEVFGAEMTPSQPNSFDNQAKAAVWTTTGAELEISQTTSDYLANESPLSAYLSFHLALSALRLQARPSTFSTSPSDLSLPDDEIVGPRVMVVGERGAGKTTLIKTLVNWRVREMKARGGKTGVLFVNLDVAEGAMTMPGTMSLTSMNALLPTTTPICSMGTTLSSGPAVLITSTATTATLTTTNGTNDWQPAPSIDCLSPPVNSLIYWHGHTSPNLNPSLYDLLVKRVGKSVRRKLNEGGIEGWKAGAIVDTPGEWSEKKNMGTVTKAVRELEINIILVVGSQKLYVEMSKLMAQNQTVRVVRVPKSDGASEPDLSYQSWMKDQQIRSYFYGGPSLTQGVLSPFSIIVKFDDLKIFRVGEAADSQAPSSALPIGVSRTVSDTELLAIDLTLLKTASQILNRILALPQAEDDAGDDAIVSSPVMGFVYISAIDAVKKKVTLLSPLPGRLPRRTLLLASLNWQDS